ncbi:hypothetical protein [Pseudaquabacterium rugosum]|uniref:Uncharacterized protein n=1 Tax=Pseudaquabacterium rugosum TaxID=2984194 RepID=A0ABU9BAC7_9BURK
MDTMDPLDLRAPDAPTTAKPPPPAWLTHALCVLWPAFLMAAVLEMLVFAWIDPAGLLGHHGTGQPGEAIAVHSLAFLLFWATIALAIGLSHWLSDRTGDRAPAVGTRSAT